MTKSERVGRRIGQAIQTHPRIALALMLLLFVGVIGGILWDIVSRIQHGRTASLIGSLVVLVVVVVAHWRRAINRQNG
jgi:hypothetical protein